MVQRPRGTALLFHGLAGTPFEVAPVARALAEAGLVPHTPPLPGHGQGPDAYLAATFSQWRAFARAEYRRLSAAGPVLLGGYSLGGILALDAAEAAAKDGLAPPVGLLLLATPLTFRSWRKGLRLSGPGGWRFRLLPLTARLWPVISTPPRSEAARAVAPWHGHEGILCLRHFAEMEAALRDIRRRLPLVRVPLCVIQHRHDASCPPGHAAWLVTHCESPHAALHLLRTESPHGGHLPAPHAESRERVAAIARAFARRSLAISSSAAGAPF